MKTEGQKAYERYMSSLAGVLKFNEMPKFEDQSPVVKKAFEAAADVKAPIHSEYNPVVAPAPAVTTTTTVTDKDSAAG